MQIISLNILGGKIYEPLKEYISAEAGATDVFCFQEVTDCSTHRIMKDRFFDGEWSDIYSDLTRQLPDFTGHYAQIVEDNYHGQAGVSYGNVIFVKKHIQVESEGQIFLRGEKNVMQPTDREPPSSMQYLRFTAGTDQFTIANVHGIVDPGSKLDTPERLMQSARITQFLASEPGKKILCGDFNLMPQTQSIELIEAAGFINLIKTYKITTTRSKINHAKYPADDLQYFADFTFVSPDIQVLDFQVPQIEVSDHLPMKLVIS